MANPETPKVNSEKRRVNSETHRVNFEKHRVNSQLAPHIAQKRLTMYGQGEQTAGNILQDCHCTWSSESDTGFMLIMR